jgi:hypothetical protein
MAGAFTHFIICDVAKRKRSITDPELRKLLNRHSEFLFLGAASPDLPYLSFKTGRINWADVMHYEKTNGIAINGHDELKNVWTSKQTADEIKLIWLFGFVSHLVADATIHPVVQAIVGPYDQNEQTKTEHRICEMTQDALIYNERKNTDIRYAEFSSALKFCGKSDHFDNLMDFWAKLGVNTYSDKNEEPEPKLWFTTYTEAIDTAEGGSGVVALFRHLGIGEDYIYKTRDEIISDYQADYDNYFVKVNLPDGNTGKFTKDGFDRAVNNVVDAWNKLYEGLYSNINVADIIRNWYLDTGVDMDSPEGTVTYWA